MDEYTHVVPSFFQWIFLREVGPIFTIFQQRCGLLWKLLDSNMNEVVVKSHEISGFQNSRQAVRKRLEPSSRGRPGGLHVSQLKQKQKTGVAYCGKGFRELPIFLVPFFKYFSAF